MSDAQHYRTKEEVDEYRKIDPITQVLDVILEKKYASEDEVKLWDKEIKDKVEECQKFAEESPFPRQQSTIVYSSIYCSLGLISFSQPHQDTRPPNYLIVVCQRKVGRRKRTTDRLDGGWQWQGTVILNMYLSMNPRHDGLGLFESIQ